MSRHSTLRPQLAFWFAGVEWCRCLHLGAWAAPALSAQPRLAPSRPGAVLPPRSNAPSALVSPHHSDAHCHTIWPQELLHIKNTKWLFPLVHVRQSHPECNFRKTPSCAVGSAQWDSPTCPQQAVPLLRPSLCAPWPRQHHQREGASGWRVTCAFDEDSSSPPCYSNASRRPGCCSRSSLQSLDAPHTAMLFLSDRILRPSYWPVFPQLHSIPHFSAILRSSSRTLPS